MGVKLTTETTVTIDHRDLCAILSEHFCGSYGVFTDMTVEAVREADIGPEFVLTLTPKPKEAE